MSTDDQFWITPTTPSEIRANCYRRMDELIAAGGAQVNLSGKRETRSVRQNRYLWGVVYATVVSFMRDHHGRDYSDEAIHETLKELYLPSRVEQLASREVRIYRSTTKLTKREFSEYVEHCIRWAAEFGCVVPLPDEVLLNNYPEAQAA